MGIRCVVIYPFYVVFLILLCCQNHVAKKFKRPQFCEGPLPSKPMSFLWSVKRDPPSYFFGTIHVPYTRVWDYIPENVKKAYETADSVFFELDLTDPYTISALTNCQLLPHGKSLADVLPRDIFKRLKRHLEYVKVVMPTWMTADQRGRGLYADYLFNAITGNWERKRPVWVMLMVNSLTESDIKSRGIPVLDLYLAQQAEQLSKRTGAVERVEEQCVPLNGLNVSQVLFALNQTLYQQEGLRAGEVSTPYTTDDLIKHYNCGDLDAVIFNQDTTQVPTLSNTSLMTPLDQMTARRIDEYFRQELIYKRNQRMGERVLELLTIHPDKSFFFAFGAGHFLGNHTVLDVIHQGGFAVEHVGPEKKLKGNRRKNRHRGVLPKFSLLRDFSTATNTLEESETVSSSDDENPLNEWEKERDEIPVVGGTTFLTNHRNRLPFQLPTPTEPPVKKNRNFNDLWVRLDSHSTRGGYTNTLPQEPQSAEAQAVQESLKVWYGLPNTSSTLHPMSYAILILCHYFCRTIITN